MTQASHAPRRRRDIPDSQIGLLATRIREAAFFLIHEKNWSLVQIEQHLEMHKNSTMRIKDLRASWTVRRELRASIRALLRTRQVEAQEGDVGDDGQVAQRTWLWNPQIDTFERLERLIHLAEAEGLNMRKAIKPQVWTKKSTGKSKKPASIEEQAETMASETDAASVGISATA